MRRKKFFCVIISDSFDDNGFGCLLIVDEWGQLGSLMKNVLIWRRMEHLRGCLAGKQMTFKFLKSFLLGITDKKMSL